MKIQFEKPRSIPLTQQLYPDRGMLKWQGFILSDHNEVMDFERAVRQAALEELPAEPENWNKLLWESYDTGISVIVRFVDEAGVREQVGTVRSVHPEDFLLEQDGSSWRIDYQVVRSLRHKVDVE